MLTAHRIALKPHNNQATYFKKACGVARFPYNWGLAEWKANMRRTRPIRSCPSPARRRCGGSLTP